jgi:hypothetical protein
MSKAWRSMLDRNGLADFDALQPVADAIIRSIARQPASIRNLNIGTTNLFELAIGAVDLWGTVPKAIAVIEADEVCYISPPRCPRTFARYLKIWKAARVESPAAYA